MNGRRGADWGNHWEPRRRAVSFGSDDPRVTVLEGGFAPPAIPVDMTPGPPRGLQRVLVEEPIEGWWTQAGRFGFKFQGLVPDVGETIGLTESVALPGPPKPLWLNWFRYNRGLSTEFDPTQNFELRGRLIYGVGGAQNIVDVDLISGIQMPIVCNSITVQFVTYNPYAPGVAAAYVPGEVACGVMFGQGAASGALPATWSTPIFEATGGNFVDNNWPIPDFARSVAVHTSINNPALLVNTSLNFLDAGGALISTVLMDPAVGGYALATQERGVPIPAGANSAILLSPGVGNGARAQLKFFLAL